MAVLSLGLFGSVAKAYGAARALRNASLVLCLASGTALADPEPVTILALGDSLTQGYGLPEHEGFVPQLAAWLLAAGEQVSLINGGVSGDTTQGGLSRIEWSLAPGVDGVIVALGGNDVLRGISPEVSRANLTGILDVTTAAGLPVLLVGIEAPGNFGPAYKEAFDAIYPELSQEYEALLYPSFFAVFAGEGDVPAELGEMVQADGIHPSARGVAEIVADMGPAVQDLITLIRAR
ncbi:MAG: arylesterase [Pseudomonadota bacterium]